jgi:hypothetical protein
MFATAQTIIHFNFTILSPYLYSLGSRMTTDKPDDIPLIPDTLLIKTNVLLLALGETDQRISGLKLQLASVESSRVKLTLEVGRAEDDNMSVLMNNFNNEISRLTAAITAETHDAAKLLLDINML